MKVDDYIASGVLEQYVLGDLTATEANEVARMASLYPEVRQEITLIEDTQQAITENLAIKPPLRVRESILATISGSEEKDADEKPSLTKKNKKIHYLRYGVAASFTLKLVAMAVAAHFWIQWQRADDRFARLQERYENLEQESQQITKALFAVSDPDFQTIVLKSQGTDTNNRALVYWNEKTLEIYINPNNLPKNNNDQQYQLWGMVNGNPQSLGTFDVSGTSSLPQIITMQGVDNLSSFAITLEPDGGSTSPSPQSPIYQ
uniref:Anti-sigma factor n=1 Tax=Roseihalotalea indica TaxID=2867963 RepID=A0AA49JHE0_9BACT|nr:anti-sigma factor [Tunicatimonas sp. TK19036]